MYLTGRCNWFLAYFPSFEKKRKYVYAISMLSVCESPPPPIHFWMPEPIVMKLGMYIIALEFISTADFINPTHQSVCLYVYLRITARQRLCKDIPATTKNCWRRRFICGPWRVKVSRRLILHRICCFSYVEEIRGFITQCNSCKLIIDGLCANMFNKTIRNHWKKTPFNNATFGTTVRSVSLLSLHPLLPSKPQYVWLVYTPATSSSKKHC
jgi:hypothetical protein